MATASRGCHATLRVYHPLAAFSDAERRRWRPLLSRRREGLHASSVAEHGSARRLVLREPAAVAPAADGDADAHVLAVGRDVLLSPWDLRRRCLEAFEDWADGLAEEVAAAFVAPGVAAAAREELEGLRASGARPVAARTSTWVVPVAWAVLVQPAERTLLREPGGTTLVYRATVADARARVRSAVELLSGTVPDGNVLAVLLDLAAWLEDVDRRGVVELDYGGVGDLLGPAALEQEDTVGDVAEALGGLAAGDGEAAGEAYARAVARWSAAAEREQAA